MSPIKVVLYHDVTHLHFYIVKESQNYKTVNAKKNFSGFYCKTLPYIED